MRLLLHDHLNLNLFLIYLLFHHFLYLHYKLFIEQHINRKYTSSPSSSQNLLLLLRNVQHLQTLHQPLHLLWNMLLHHLIIQCQDHLLLQTLHSPSYLLLFCSPSLSESSSPSSSFFICFLKNLLYRHPLQHYFLHLHLLYQNYYSHLS